MQWSYKYNQVKNNSKTLFKTDWLSVKETKDGYIYVHEERMFGHGVAVLGHRTIKQKKLSGTIPKLEILGRFEICPPHGDEIELCALTGSVEEQYSDEIGLKYAKSELFEEAGIKADIEQFKSIGTIRPSKSSDTTIHLFSIELNGEEPSEESPGDGSDNEKGTYCKWISLEDAIECKDALVHAMILRANLV